MGGHRAHPSRIIKIKQLGRYGLIDRIKPPFLVQRGFARIILIGNGIPARQTLRCGLIIQCDPRIGQVIEQRLQPSMEKRQPMLYPLMFAPGADRLI